MIGWWTAEPSKFYRPPKRRVEDGLKLQELIVLRALDAGDSQSTVAQAHHYSRAGIEAMLKRLRLLYGAPSTPALLRDPRVRAELDSADGTV